MPKKVLLVANTAWYLFNFRLPLAQELKRRGYEPVFVGPADAYAEKLRAAGFVFRELPMRRASVNPFVELGTLARLPVPADGFRPTPYIGFRCVK